MRPELGTKRDCPSCDAKFYDLNRSPAACPKCGYTFAAEMASPRTKPARPPKEVVAPTPVKAKPVAAAAATASLGDDDDDELVVGDGTEVSLEELEDDEVEVDDGDGDGEEDTFLEQDDEERGSDVSDLIGGHPQKEDER